MKTKPKLLLVFPYFPPDPGAAAVRGEAFAKYLAKDFNVEVITKNNLKHENYQDLEITSRLDLSVKLSPVKLFRDYKLLAKKMRSINPDIVLASAPNYLLAALSILVALSIGAKSVADLRDQAFAGSWYKRFLNMTLFRFVVWKADLVFVTTAEQKRQVLKESMGVEAGKVIVVPNGVDTELYPRDIPDWKSREVDVLFLGSINPERNLEQLTHFCNQISSASAAIKIRFVGVDPKSPSAVGFLEGLLHKKNIEFIEEVSHIEAKRQTSLAKFGIVSITPNQNLKYMLPVKVFEYMAGGAVVLGLFDESSEALKSFFDQYKIGFYDDDGLRLAKKLVEENSNIDELYEVSQRNKAKVADFSRKKIVENTINELQRLAQ